MGAVFDNTLRYFSNWLFVYVKLFYYLVKFLLGKIKPVIWAFFPVVLDCLLKYRRIIQKPRKRRWMEKPVKTVAVWNRLGVDLV